MSRKVPELCRMQQSFGGNAADMQANAAQFGVFFDNRGLQAILASAHRCGVAAGAATNHNQVVCHVTPFYMARLYTMVGGMARISFVLLLFAGVLPLALTAQK